MFKFSDWNHISKAGPIHTSAWHINNLGRKFITGPNIDYLFRSTKRGINSLSLTPIHQTLPVSPHDPWSHLEDHPQDHSSLKHYESQALIRYIFLPMLSYFADFASHHNIQAVTYLEGHWQISSSSSHCLRTYCYIQKYWYLSTKHKLKRCMSVPLEEWTLL